MKGLYTMKDKISVIVAVYNSAKYLQKCIESIIGQTYKNLEIILVDDGSTDDSSMICDEYAAKDKRIVVIHQQNIGRTRNRGLEICTGDYIGFIDGDDRIAEDMYELLYSVIRKYDADISVCGRFIEDDEHGVYGTCNDDGKTIVYNTEDALRKIIEDSSINSYVWDKLYRKEIFENYRFENGHILEDIASMYKIFMRAEKIVACNIPKYYYLQRKDSVLHTRNEAMNWDQFCIYKERLAELEQDYPELRELLIVKLVSFGVVAYNCILLEKTRSKEKEEHKKEILLTIQNLKKEMENKKYGGRALRYRVRFLTAQNYDKIYPVLKKMWVKLQ